MVHAVIGRQDNMYLHYPPSNVYAADSSQHTTVANNDLSTSHVSLILSAFVLCAYVAYVQPIRMLDNAVNLDGKGNIMSCQVR